MNSTEPQINLQVKKSIGQIDHALREFSVQLEKSGSGNKFDSILYEIVSLRSGLKNPKVIEANDWVKVLSQVNDHASELDLAPIPVADVLALLDHYVEIEQMMDSSEST